MIEYLGGAGSEKCIQEGSVLANLSPNTTVFNSKGNLLNRTWFVTLIFKADEQFSQFMSSILTLCLYCIKLVSQIPV